MAEAPEIDDAPRRQRNWNGLSAVIASLVGLLALVLSAYSAWVQDRQAKSEVWPHLTFSRTPSEHSYYLVNKGVGPAVLREVSLTMGGTSYDSWYSLQQAMGLPHVESNYTTLSQSVLQPGEVVRVLNIVDDAGWAAFDSRRGEIELRICYCSVFNQCWLMPEQSALEPPIGSECPASPEPAFKN